jgi:ribonuclease J
LHASDFKFDDNPGVGAKTDVKRLEELKGKVKLVTIDTLNADEVKKTPSESVAKEMLKDVLMHKELEGKGIIVSTFSSHLARLRTIYALAPQA